MRRVKSFSHWFIKTVYIEFRLFIYLFLLSKCFQFRWGKACFCKCFTSFHSNCTQNLIFWVAKVFFWEWFMWFTRTVRAKLGSRSPGFVVVELWEIGWERIGSCINLIARTWTQPLSKAFEDHALFKWSN